MSSRLLFKEGQRGAREGAGEGQGRGQERGRERGREGGRDLGAWGRKSQELYIHPLSKVTGNMTQ